MKNKLSLLFPDKELDFKKISDITFHDIGMDAIVKKLSRKENEQTYIYNVMKLMSDDARNAGYRSDVFNDILENKKMRDDITELFDRINFLRDYGSFKHDRDHEPGIWDLLHRLDELKDYVECIEALNNCLSGVELLSDGMQRLRDYVTKLYSDNALEDLKKDISMLRASTSNLKSVTVGINLNERFEAAGIGLISVNDRAFTKSSIVSNFVDRISKSDNIHKGTDWNGEYRFNEFSVRQTPMTTNDVVIPALSPIAMMSVRYVPEGDDSVRGVTSYMDQITNRMLSQTVRHLRDILNRYTILTITDITDLMPEFIYYIRWAEYIEGLIARGFRLCKPVALDAPMPDGKSMSAKGIYNLKLLEEKSVMPSDIVVNDLSFSEEQNLYVLTGANRGGKTTITQTVGQLFFMAQAGIYVTGESFEYVPVDLIFTHFPADEDKTLDLGRLGEECKRFRQIYSDASKNSLILLNETFSTTSFEEGYYIAKDCIKAVLKKGARTIYNTHMHKLAADIDEINSDSSEAKAASLIVVSDAGKRSYEVRVAPPVGMSYAGDIAEKYGVTYELLTKQ
ncbi:MAG: DNA mismatch repair protein [Butyrivibrio sp.]|nr:DNA mismatch repair protein [Butyrivibrio sp.]